LVRNDLVLTNWHVARTVIGDKTQQRNLGIRFDYADEAGAIQPGAVCKAADDCVVAHSPAGQKERAEGEAEPSAEELDFALLRLAAPAPDAPDGPRTPIALNDRGDLAPGATVLVLQHPNGAPLKLTIGAWTGMNPRGNRLFHDANTQPGSSGSACLNAKLEFIGLHNAADSSYPGFIGAPPRNQAVPIREIAAQISKANIRF
jgi:S1-C subfamily serine protease